MKPLVEQTHYEILEVDTGADREEVERAYRLARATYAEGSVATYSIFDDSDAEALRQRIEAAYEVLSDDAARKHYDATLGKPERGLDSGLPSVAPPPAPASPPQGLEVRREISGFEDLEDGDDSGSFDGARLRRLRLLRGTELTQIAEITKINTTYLGFLEEERFEDLPGATYVRGFVVAYAKSLGLDPAPVAAAYMERYRERSSDSSRHRLRRRS